MNTKELKFYFYRGTDDLHRTGLLKINTKPGTKVSPYEKHFILNGSEIE